MTNTAEGSTPTQSNDTTTHSSLKKRGRASKANPKESEEKVSVTFSFSPGFAKRLRMAVSASSESTSDYVERILSPRVRADLKRAIEGLVE